MRGKWTRPIAVLVAALALGSEGAHTQTLATARVMHDKLLRAQRILDALMKSEGDPIATEADALARLTQEPGWTVLRTPEYVRYSSAFLNATTNLAEAARDGDFDAAAVHYTGMVMTCYQCHRYVKRARLTEIDPIGDGDDQRTPPAKPAQPPTAVPRPPAPRPPSTPRPPTPPPHQPGAIYPYPPVFQPGYVYRFPYGVYPYYRWGYPYAPYWYPWYGYAYGYTVPPDDWVTASPEEYGTVQLDVTPSTASVIVDGFYAGTIADLDHGQLHLTPGPHHIEVQAEGYQTSTFDVHVQVNHTITFRTTLTPGSDGSR